MAFQRILNVAEKNDAANRISQLLSNFCSRRREGFSVYNKIYEFPFSLNGQNVQMVFTSVSGHLTDLRFADAYHRKWTACPPSVLFDAPVEIIVSDNMKDIEKTLIRECKIANKLIIWTDCDREGEHIGNEVYNVCKRIKPTIDVRRARFSEITSTAVHSAVNNLSTLNFNESNAVEVRRELDLKIGAAFTRLQTLKLQRAFPQLSSQVISFGPCQFPTLGFVVERFKQREAFVSEPFWKLVVCHRQDNCEARFKWARGRLFDESIATIFHEIVTDGSPFATVTAVQSKQKSKWRPVPLDTVELEKVASRKLHLSAKNALLTAEKLYTKGIISYPRTETNIFPKSLNLYPLVEAHISHPVWGEFASEVLRDGPNPRNGRKSDNAHPPIHPLKLVMDLSGNEKIVYEYIVRHFLACCSKDALGLETRVDISLAGEEFVCSGLMILEKNYLRIYIYDHWSENSIPIYQEKQRFKPTSVQIVPGATEPPPLLTEADLIALMEKHGIGTDATHAEHIEKIKSRDYAILQDSRFYPCDLGLGLVSGYEMIGKQLSRPELRAKTEQQLISICSGTRSHIDVKQEACSEYKLIFEVVEREILKLVQCLEIYYGNASQTIEPDFSESIHVRNCASCQNSMILKKVNSDYFIGCSGYPACKSKISIGNCASDIKSANRVCANCESTILAFTFKPGKVPPYFGLEYESCIKCDKNLLECFTIVSGKSNQENSITSTAREVPNTQLVQSRTASLNSSQNRLNRCNSVSSNNHASTSSSSTFLDRMSSSNQIMCGCNILAKKLTVKKQGPNQGRFFYACSVSKCNFFLWENDKLPGVNSNPLIKNCNCNVPSVSRIVQKEGPNTGRRFFVCGQNSSCNFFEWDDSASATIPSNTSSNISSGKRKCSQCGDEGHTKRTCTFR